MSTYHDGWADAVREMRIELEAQPTCPQCALDRVTFTGLAAAATIDPPDNVRGELATDVAEVLIETAAAPTTAEQARLMAQTRYVADHEPALAADVLTMLTLALVRHHRRDNIDHAIEAGAMTPDVWPVPGSEWGR